MLNYDSSFFNIQVDGVVDSKKNIGTDISQRVQSLEITEELGKGITGNISLIDTDYHEYSYLLKMGKKIKIAWGYKNNDLSGADVYAKKENQKEIFTTARAQRYVSGSIRNPSGGGSEGGIITYNCSFITLDGMVPTNKVYSGRSMTKGDVVSQVMDRMKCTQKFIKFRRQKESVYGDTAIRQDSSSDFRFLNTLSTEWRCMFRVAMDKNNNSIGLFCDYDDDKTVENFFSATMGATGDTALLEYKFGRANVKSYSWSQSDAENGSGDNAQIRMVNGQPQIFRTVATTESVKVYKLDVNKIRKEFSDRAGSPSDILNHMNKLLEYSTMEELIQKGYYVAATETTAPQGAGFSMTVEMIGNPLVTAPTRIKFGKGFPDIFRALKGKIVFFVQSVTHKIDRSGYSMSLKIADSFSQAGGTVR